MVRGNATMLRAGIVGLIIIVAAIISVTLFTDFGHHHRTKRIIVFEAVD
jgi:hypothetical protein